MNPETPEGPHLKSWHPDCEQCDLAAVEEPGRGPLPPSPSSGPFIDFPGDPPWVPVVMGLTRPWDVG